MTSNSKPNFPIKIKGTSLKDAIDLVPPGTYQESNAELLDSVQVVIIGN